MSAKLAVLSLGLWLAAAQGFAAQACCLEMSSPKTPCEGCGEPGDSDTSSAPACCVSLETPKDVEAAFPKNEVPQPPVIVDLLPEETFTPRLLDSADLITEQVSSLAEGPPLYLRYEVLLI